MLQFFDVLRKEKSFGPTPLFRVLLVTASLFAGVFSLFIILAKAYTETIFTQELLLRYAYVFLFLVIIPLLLTSIKTIIAGKGLDGMREQLFGFFAFKFVYLFMYMFTFFTFIGWLFILVLSYINTKASLGQKQS